MDGIKCSRCDEIAVRYQGHQHLCAKHYRFGQMRGSANCHGKAVPSHEELHKMCGNDLICPDCSTAMNWLAVEGQATVVSLQHYRDGSMALVCRSCNTRHAYMTGDEYREMDKSNKQCSDCKAIRPRSEFYVDKGRSGNLQNKSICKSCSDDAVKKWKDANRDRYNEYQRQYRARRKTEGNPVRSGS